ncbi:serine/threonine-protein phosphatase [Kitasatospora sp. NA04385]|uniref:PP2C family protein-serine/threonine phosphatase n=1 Tax=Kitasatospora sp. NA04385 TaxID=2742135 RepID=UPI001590A1BF|nr:PP2C family protein-serine/threonine phosphatase [Kitasatospora sp. NA04385]QKW21906.1 serine/threonine-protein phosphatase [Kitasatospora sp. NA04385]
MTSQQVPDGRAGGAARGGAAPAPRPSGRAADGGWTAGLHRLWRSAQTSTDVTDLSAELYDLLLDQPGVAVVSGTRFTSSGTALYTRSSTRPGEVPERLLLPAGDAWAGRPAPEPGLVRRFALGSEQARGRPEYGTWRAAGAVRITECPLPLEDGGWAVLSVGLAAGRPAPPRLGTRLTQVSDVVAACNDRIVQERANARLQARDALLAEASLQMDASLDVEETLQRVARMTVPAIAEGCLVHLHRPEGLVLVASAHLAAGVQRRFTAAGGDLGWTDDLLSKLSSLREGTVLTGDELAGTPFGPSSGAAARAVTVNPLRARGRLLGTVTFVYEREPARVPPPLFLADLALRAALAIDNATLYEERRQNVASLQQHLLPAVLPTVPGVELAAAYEVGDAALEVGGDFYDAVPGRRSLSLLVGDVCGRGAEAAALTGLARHTLRTLLEDDLAPAAALTRLNCALRTANSRKFVTGVVLSLTPAADGAFEARIANAGHPQALVLRADGTVAPLGGTGGLLLGVLDDYQLAESTDVLRPGDTAVLLTDGITESRSPDGAFFEDRLAAALGGLAGLPPEGVVTGLARAAIGFGRGSADDMAVLAMRVAPGVRPGGDGEGNVA